MYICCGERDDFLRSLLGWTAEGGCPHIGVPRTEANGNEDWARRILGH